MTIKNKKYAWLAAAGVVVATLVVCFSLSWPPVLRDKIQGAIGQRDVYRQKQLTDQVVGVAGQAKVTVDDVQKFLESPEFKTLAKDPQFQKMLAEGRVGDLNNLMNQGRRLKAQDQGAQADQFRRKAQDQGAEADQLRRRAQDQGAEADQLRRRAQDQGAEADQLRRRAQDQGAQADQLRRRAQDQGAEASQLTSFAHDSQVAFTALANNAQSSAAFSLVAGSQALQSLAQSGALIQATAEGAVQNSVIQSCRRR